MKGSVMLNKCVELIKKYRELIIYAICGGLTTLVDFAVYFILTRYCGMEDSETLAQTISVIVAIFFAFVVNKWFVFLDKRVDIKTLLTQFISFASMRAVSGVVQIGAFWLFADVLGLYDMAVKLVAAVVVVILNYIFSKLIIFKKGKKENKDA